MVHIWKSLVADSKKTIDENLDLIIDDLLVQCGSRLWRSREASCLALADIIQGRKFYEVIRLLSFFLILNNKLGVLNELFYYRKEILKINAIGM